MKSKLVVAICGISIILLSAYFIYNISGDRSFNAYKKELLKLGHSHSEIKSLEKEYYANSEVALQLDEYILKMKEYRENNNSLDIYKDKKVIPKTPGASTTKD